MNEINIPAGRTLAVLDILKQSTNSDHRISMNDLILQLEDRGFPSERRAVYRSIEALVDAGHDIRFSRAGGMQGYYFRSEYSPAEILVLVNSVNESPSLSKSVSARLSRQLLSELSVHDQRALPVREPFAGKTDNNTLLETIEVLLQAVRKSHTVSFQYYDLSITRQKRYRRNRENYELFPVSVLSNNGRYYCVFWSDTHQSFANYRIDKMTDTYMTETEHDPVRFDAKRWMEASFMMYQGDPATITLECDLSLTSVVFDQFGRDVLISEIGDTSFTVSIHGSVTPTLTSWILMFYDRIRVKAPDSLKQELLAIAAKIQSTYKNNL